MISFHIHSTTVHCQAPPIRCASMVSVAWKAPVGGLLAARAVVQSAAAVYWNQRRAVGWSRVVAVRLVFIYIMSSFLLRGETQYTAVHSNLYLNNGIFNSDNLNDWQHSCMYLAFMISGVVDLLGHRRRLPVGTEQCFLALAFLVEGILLGFHLKGPDFEV